VNRSAIARRVASADLSGKRIAPIEVEGVRVWLKDFDQPTRAEWERIQRVVFGLSRLHILRPVPSLSGTEGARNEVAAIHRLTAIGVRVPQLLWQEGARIVLSDIGETLRDLQRRAGAASIETTAKSAARELSRIHQRGLAHGRPILRNMTWDGETVGFLDFEERPTDVMPLETAQARDVMLLLISAARRCEADLVKEVFAAYSRDMPPGIEGELQRVSRLAGTSIGRFGGVLAGISSRNVQSIVKALAAVRALLKNA
jgi:tRNA A-37 threonylcarbamoyl transferase component Bud32